MNCNKIILCFSGLFFGFLLLLLWWFCCGFFCLIVCLFLLITLKSILKLIISLLKQSNCYRRVTALWEGISFLVAVQLICSLHVEITSGKCLKKVISPTDTTRKTDIQTCEGEVMFRKLNVRDLIDWVGLCFFLPVFSFLVFLLFLIWW